MVFIYTGTHVYGNAIEVDPKGKPDEDGDKFLQLTFRSIFHDLA